MTNPTPADAARRILRYLFAVGLAGVVTYLLTKL